MQAIGLVPWVRRVSPTDDVVREATIPVAAATTPSEPTPVAPPPAALTAALQKPAQDSSANVSDQTIGQLVACSGDTESPLLLIFDNRDGTTTWPLSKEDDALLDGMLRAIGMSKSAVCSCAMLQDASVQGQQSLEALCQPPRKRFLYFGGEVIAADEHKPIPMIQAAFASELNGWQLPSLATLREAPQRKRQAWITLKLLRSALDNN